MPQIADGPFNDKDKKGNLMPLRYHIQEQKLFSEKAEAEQHDKAREVAEMKASTRPLWWDNSQFNQTYYNSYQKNTFYNAHPKLAKAKEFVDKISHRHKPGS